MFAFSASASEVISVPSFPNNEEITVVSQVNEELIIVVITEILIENPDGSFEYYVFVDIYIFEY